jgi:hypothetical protein
MALQTQSAPTGLTKFVPIAGWLPRYKPAWLRFDLVAGLTAAAVVIPQAMAYAAIAALNPEPLRVVEQSSLGEALGREGMHFNLHQAVDAYVIKHAPIQD